MIAGLHLQIDSQRGTGHVLRFTGLEFENLGHGCQAAFSLEQGTEQTELHFNLEALQTMIGAIAELRKVRAND